MSRSDRRIQAVIFDLDDTLIDWSAPAVDRLTFYRPRVERVHRFLTDQGMTLPPLEEFSKIVDQASMAAWAKAKESWEIASFGQVFESIFIDLKLDATKIDVCEVLRVFDWNAWPGVELYPDTIPVLTKLRDLGYRLGLLTNSYMPMWMRDVELASYGLLDLLDTRVSSGDIGYLKPHPAIYEHTLDMMGVPADRTVFVGDRPANDIAGANRVGLISVLIDPPHLTRELDGIKPDFIIASLSELLPILGQLEEMDGSYE